MSFFDSKYIASRTTVLPPYHPTIWHFSSPFVFAFSSPGNFARKRFYQARNTIRSVVAFGNKGNKERTTREKDEAIQVWKRIGGIRNLTLNSRCVEDSLIKTTRGDGRSEICETKIINESNECSRNANTGGRIH